MKVYLLRMYGNIAKDDTEDQFLLNYPNDTDVFLTKDSAYTVLEDMKDSVDQEDDRLLLYEVELNEEGYYAMYDLIWGFWGWHWHQPINFEQGYKFEENDNCDISITLVKGK